LTTHRLLVVLLLASLGAAAGCGRRGPPLPPLGRGPLPPAAVRTRQFGEEIRIAVAATPLRRDGRPLRGPAVVEVLLLLAERADEAASPWAGPRRTRDFLRRAAVVSELPLETGDGEAKAVRIEAALPAGRLAEVNLERATLVLAARVRDGRGRRSDLSPRTVLSPRAPPSAPQGLEVRAAESAVELGWSAPEGDEPAAYHVYRRDDDGPWPPAPRLVVPGGETQVSDGSASYGRRYTYAVRAAAREGRPYIESVSTEPVSLDYEDRFPPPVPEQAAVLEVAAGLRVVWFPGRGTPAARYRVQRAEPEGAFADVATVLPPASDWTDPAALPGRRYLYRVLAEDEMGNVSAPSEVADGMRVEREESRE
jgi:hypothetical protein